MALTASGSVQSLADWLRRSFAWWTGELRECIPARLRRRIAGTNNVLSLQFDDSAVRVELEQGESRSVLAVIPTAPEVGSKISIPSPRQKVSEIRLVLSSRAAMRRRVELPAAASGALDEAIEFEIDRLTPFRSQDVVFRAKPLGLGSTANTVSCDVVVVPRAQINAAVTWATQHGIQCDRAFVQQGEQTPTFLTTLPLRMGTERLTRRRLRLPWLAALLAVVTGVAAYSFHLERQQAILEAYLGKITEARKAATAAIGARDRVDQLRAALGETMGIRHTSPLIVAILGELTGRLPDDSWLTEMNLTNNRLALSGYSSSAAGLVPVIDASALFEGTRLSAPVTSDSRLNRERFSIETAITPQGAP